MVKVVGADDDQNENHKVEQAYFLQPCPVQPNDSDALERAVPLQGSCFPD